MNLKNLNHMENSNDKNKIIWTKISLGNLFLQIFILHSCFLFNTHSTNAITDFKKDGYEPTLFKKFNLINTKQTQNSNYKHSNIETIKSKNQKYKEVIFEKSSNQLNVIVLYAFERSFRLNLVLNKNGVFLSPNLRFIQNKTINSRLDNISINSSTPYSNCFFNGKVDDDLESILYLNLCNHGHVVGSFILNSKEYFIEPSVEFDSKFFDEYEYSFVDFEKNFPITENHILFVTKSKDTDEEKNISSCASEDADQYENQKKKIINDDYSIKNLSNETKINNRYKRASKLFPYIVDRRVYLELLVVVDQKMYEYYGENLENHIFTLMFMTTQLYQHPSLINPVRVYISDIIYVHTLEKNIRDGLKIDWGDEKLLTQFCKWQYNYRRQTQMSHQVDVAILITKYDICKSKDVCQTLGMARLNQVCVPFQNCAVIEDSGINTAYTIAHEIGHLLGMKHVDEQRCQDLDTTSTQMMASMLDLTKKTQVWSNCSVLELNDFLRTGDAECLFNEPNKNPNFINRNLEFENTLEQFNEKVIQNAIYPGLNELYSLKNQCQQIFGPESDDCDHNPDEDCKILWCKAESPNSDDNSYQCVTTNTKWADGTPCRINGAYSGNICIYGECVNPRHIDHQPIDGGFSEWSEFTSCSRSCGGGIKKKYRTCDNPKPKNGGKYCVGKRVVYESCNTQDCPFKESDFRDEQCRNSVKRMNSIKLADQMGFSSNNSFEWKAYYSQDPRRKCVLFCRTEEKSEFAVLSPLVIDGTKCGLDTYDICVNGHCLPGGCDNKLYSNKADDKCGICGGENKYCEETREVFNQPLSFGYNYLKTIPARTTSIYIHRQKNTDDLSCLSLRSSNLSLLNGHYIISKTSTNINFEGKIIDYIVNETDEIIQSRGNFSEDLIVQFLTGSTRIHNHILFNYYVPKWSMLQRNEQRDYKNEIIGYNQYDNLEFKNYQLQIQNPVSYDQCDKICDGQRKVTIKKCKNRDCQSYQKTEICNSNCYLNLTSYSVGCLPVYGDCGEGYENIQLQCVQVYKNSDLRYSVDLNHCDRNEIKAKNSTRKKCHIPCDNYEWVLLDYECSCENGLKKPTFNCFDKNHRRWVPHTWCKDVTKPLSVMSKCDSKCYQWRTSDWYECSKTCDGGQKRRDLFCVFNRSHIAQNYLCNHQKQPTEMESCNTHSCPAWSASTWSECYGTCNKGKRNRTLSCVYRGNQVENSLCSDLTKPKDQEDCETNECYSWKTSEWNECSVTCGKGFQTRSVYCQLERKIISRHRIDSNNKQARISTDLSTYERVPDFKCEKNIKPKDKTECINNKTCPEWRTTTWLCNCATGIRTRIVYCSTNTYTDCSIETKPGNVENCTCTGIWRATAWSKCTGGCNIGWMHRNVYCMNQNNIRINLNECPIDKKPDTRRICFECNGKWKTSNWTECSTTCGPGIQSRYVECYSSDTGENLPYNKCNLNTKPDEEQICNVRNCTQPISYEWKIVSKKTCSVTCGIGWSFREIECLTIDGKESKECKKEDRPDYYEKCDAGPCPKWEYGGWSTCSTDCGHGIRERFVVCQNSEGLVLDDKKCNLFDKPINKTTCLGNFCAKWITDNWSNCEMKTCNRVRNVRCGFENGTSLPENNCNKEEKPNYITECLNSANCKHINGVLLEADKTSAAGVLDYTNWSKCSQRCGLGFRTRNVSCRSISNNSIELPMMFCNTAQVEKLRLNCLLSVCTYHLIETWGKCSAKCGQQGVEIIERKCYENVTRTYVDLSKCKIDSNKVNESRKCYKPCLRHVKPSYEWRVSNWRECSAKCGFGNKNRTVKCWNLSDNITTTDSNCQLKNKPVDTIPCINISCGYGWFVSKWSECSKNCSIGIKIRQVYCIKISVEGYILKTTSNRCNLAEKPQSTMTCNYGECNDEYFWKTGNWSKCFPNCNLGHQRRTIECIHKNGTIQDDYSRCKQEFMPLRHQFCYTNCYASSCEKLKNLFNLDKDNDYYLNISDKIVQVYCKDMNTTEPKEYLTLKSGESKNFAEIYDKKLKHPNKCRYGPRYGANCSFCQNETVDNHGITLFSKVRLDLSQLKIIENDFAFASVLYGKPVPFGHSGDCYSSVPECQQGRLNIDLRGTSFIFDSNSKWISYGEMAHQRIYFSKDNSTIYGTCGGLCGFCKPDPTIGIKLRIV